MSYTILVVEDDEFNRDLITGLLESKGYNVIEAGDGAEGVEKATSEQPDCILMDKSLPVLDGWDAVRQLKTRGETAGIPVIALTGHATSAHRDEALAAGCDEFETKPNDLKALIEKIGRLVEPQP